MTDTLTLARIPVEDEYGGMEYRFVPVPQGTQMERLGDRLVMLIPDSAPRYIDVNAIDAMASVVTDWKSWAQMPSWN